MKDLRFISTGLHAVMDYSFGAVMGGIAFFGKNRDGKEGNPAQSYIPMGVAAGATVYSLFTDYELGLLKKIPMKTHLAMDIASGSFLLLAPFIFDMDKKFKLLFVGLGVFEILAGLFTKLEPGHNYLDLRRVEELLDVIKNKSNNIPKKFELAKEELIRIIKENVQ
jgi:hypothetical protein